MQQKLQYTLLAVLLFSLGAVGGATFDNVDTLHQLTDNTADQQNHGTSPYAGQETREIKYLASDDIEALKEGKGGALGGLAKPAELNSYPGPRHVLDLSNELNLTKEQEQQIQALFDDMQAEAEPLGRQFLAVERQIDDAYANGTMTDEMLEQKLDEAGDLYGELRYVHLRYHFQTKDLLTNKQIQHYDQLRGYTASNPCDDIPDGINAETHKQHMGCDT